MKKISDFIKSKSVKKISLIILFIAIVIGLFAGIFLYRYRTETIKKIYTLTEKSEELIANIPDDEQIDIYLINYKENSNIAYLANQYNMLNKNINVKTIYAEENNDLISKYEIEQDGYNILIVSGEKFKIINNNDLFSYNYNIGSVVDLSEEKITKGIISVSSIGKNTKLYILKGHNEYSIENILVSFKKYLEEENYEINELELVKGNIPEDCEALIIFSPEKDFEDVEMKKIKQYINNGGNILWMSDTQTGKGELKNIQSILDMYGVKLHLNGYIIEQDTSRIIMQSPDLILPIINDTEFTKELATEGMTLFLDSSKLTFEPDEKLTEMGVTKTDLLTTSDTAFFRTDFAKTSITPEEGEEVGKQIVGATLEKTIDENKVSKLVIYANNYFATDTKIKVGEQEISAIDFYNNLDLILNSVAYVADIEDQIIIRKNIEI